MKPSLFFKTILVASSLFLMTANSSFAFLFEMKYLEPTEIRKLSDDALADAYRDVLIEVEATKMFYSRGGLTPREYDKFKELIHYRVTLMLELQKRKIEIPKIEP